jgi:hypothetical protein
MTTSIYPDEINQVLNGENALFIERMNNAFPKLASYSIWWVWVLILFVIRWRLSTLQIIWFSATHLALIAALFFWWCWVYMFTKKWARIICTSTRIIHYTKNKYKSTPWEQVTHKFTRYGWGDNLAAIIELTTGKSFYLKHGWWRKWFEADKILINGLAGIDQLESIIIQQTKNKS